MGNTIGAHIQRLTTGTKDQRKVAADEMVDLIRENGPSCVCGYVIQTPTHRLTLQEFIAEGSYGMCCAAECTPLPLSRGHSVESGGSEGRIRRASSDGPREMPTDTALCVKLYFDRQNEMVVKEVDALYGLFRNNVVHPHIAELYCVHDDAQCIAADGAIVCARLACSVFEMCTGGEMWSYVQSKTGFIRPFPLDVARYYFRQLLAGVTYLHAKNLYHRDIKAENLVLDQFGQLKLIDFTCAKHISIPVDALLRSTTSGLGTPCYRPPEYARQMSEESRIDVVHDPASFDVWCLGQVLWFMLAADTMLNESGVFVFPFEDRSRLALLSELPSWDCEQCTFRNPARRRRCELCGDSSPHDGSLLLPDDFNAAFWSHTDFKVVDERLPPETRHLLNLLFIHSDDTRPSLIALHSHPWVRAADPLDMSAQLEAFLDEHGPVDAFFERPIRATGSVSGALRSVVASTEQLRRELGAGVFLWPADDEVLSLAQGVSQGCLDPQLEIASGLMCENRWNRSWKTVLESMILQFDELIRAHRLLHHAAKKRALAADETKALARFEAARRVEEDSVIGSALRNTELLGVRELLQACGFVAEQSCMAWPADGDIDRCEQGLHALGSEVESRERLDISRRLQNSLANAQGSRETVATTRAMLAELLETMWRALKAEAASSRDVECVCSASCSASEHLWAPHWRALFFDGTNLCPALPEEGKTARTKSGTFRVPRHAIVEIEVGLKVLKWLELREKEPPLSVHVVLDSARSAMTVCADIREGLQRHKPHWVLDSKRCISDTSQFIAADLWSRISMLLATYAWHDFQVAIGERLKVFGVVGEPGPWPEDAGRARSWASQDEGEPQKAELMMSIVQSEQRLVVVVMLLTGSSRAAQLWCRHMRLQLGAELIHDGTRWDGLATATRSRTDGLCQ